MASDSSAPAGGADFTAALTRLTDSVIRYPRVARVSVNRNDLVLLLDDWRRLDKLARQFIHEESHCE